MVNPLDVKIAKGETTLRQYFKDTLELEEEIPKEYDTFEKLLEYVNSLNLGFREDGTYGKREGIIKEILNKIKREEEN